MHRNEETAVSMGLYMVQFGALSHFEWEYCVFRVATPTLQGFYLKTHIMFVMSLSMQCSVPVADMVSVDRII